MSNRLNKSRFLLGFSVCSMAFSFAAKAQLNFVQKPIQEVLIDAKAKKQIVFVDVYAVWCGPCRWMDNNTFKDTGVVNKLNKQFINLKVNGDTPEGQAFKSTYKVNDYPTYLFIAPDGKVLHRIEGVMTPGILMDEADFASKKLTNN